MIELKCKEHLKKGNFAVPGEDFTALLPDWNVAAKVIVAILNADPQTEIVSVQDTGKEPAPTQTPDKVKAALTLEIFPDRSWLLSDKDGKNLDIGRQCFSSRCGYCYEDGTSMFSFRHDGPMAAGGGEEFTIPHELYTKEEG